MLHVQMVVDPGFLWTPPARRMSATSHKATTGSRSPKTQRVLVSSYVVGLRSKLMELSFATFQGWGGSTTSRLRRILLTLLLLLFANYSVELRKDILVNECTYHASNSRFRSIVQSVGVRTSWIPIYCYLTLVPMLSSVLSQTQIFFSSFNLTHRASYRLGDVDLIHFYIAGI